MIKIISWHYRYHVFLTIRFSTLNYKNYYMQQVLTNRKVSDVIASRLYRQKAKTNVFKRFFAWCDTQEHNRFLWMAFTLSGLIVFMIPSTALPYLLSGTIDINLWILTCIINVPVIALSLAAQPTKIILPACFIAWIADVLIILGSFIIFLIK